MICYTLEDIIYHSGLTTQRATEICNLLKQEGYLVLDKETGKYRLTNDEKLLKNIKKLWRQYEDDGIFEEMSSKIEDVVQFGKPLALSEDITQRTSKDIGVPGLNMILGFSNRAPAHEEADRGKADKKSNPAKAHGLLQGHAILIKGAPGSGKTTLGMQIALTLKKNKYRTLFLTFEHDIHQLVRDFAAFSKNNGNPDNGEIWSERNIREVSRSLLKIRTPKAWENPDIIVEELTSLIDREMPNLVVIDSISRFRDLGGVENARLIFRRLLRILKCRKITSVLTAEDRQEDYPFEDYETDGVIRLEWVGDMLTLTAEKMRGMKTLKGPHSAVILDQEAFDETTFSGNHFISNTYLNKWTMEREKPAKPSIYLIPGFNVFPNIAVYNDPAYENQSQKPPTKDSDNIIKSGIAGFDELLLKTEKESGLKRKETILLVGSAGAGKTLIALNFIHEGFVSAINQSNPPKKCVVWLNFEGSKGTLEFAVNGFSKNVQKSIKGMLQNKSSNKEKEFIFIEFPPLNLDLNKIVFTLEALDKTLGIDRLVIDSITELERAKGGGQPEVKVFLAGLIQFLRNREITTMFVCRSDAFFRSIDKIEEQVSSLVDMIICIRNFDIHNQIQKGVYIQKARGRKHNSKIMRLNIDTDKGLSVEDSGWDLENLLAGDTSNIGNPRIFFKLFYENPAEEYINQKIIKDFDEHRYPGDDPKFSLVKKPSIYTEFWSFKGQYSAGHANTRVLSIPDHVVSAFRDNNRLASLEKYIKSEVLLNIKAEEHLKYRYRKDTENQKKVSDDFVSFNNEDYGNNINIDAQPCYRDYGVMVCKHDRMKDLPDGNFKNFITNWLEKAGTKLEETKKDNVHWLNETENNIYLWENLIECLSKIPRQHNGQTANTPDSHCSTLPFALPPLDEKAEFVAFFMELFWSYGGDIFTSIVMERIFNKTYDIDFEERIKFSAIRELMFMCKKNVEVKNSKIFLNHFRVALNAQKEDLKTLSKPKRSRLDFFECRFYDYGLSTRNIKLKDLKDWILKVLNGDSPNEEEAENKIINYLNQKSVISLTGSPFRKAIETLLKLVHVGGVKNPMDGEFRHRAAFSRNWYSRISQLHFDKGLHCKNYETCTFVQYKQNNNENHPPRILPEYSLLPLPLAKLDIKNSLKIYRSVSCMTYWFMVMLNNALSPEIGGNLIETINAPEYYNERLKYRLGMPISNWELNKEKFKNFDKTSYDIVSKTTANDSNRNEILGKIIKEIKKNPTTQIGTAKLNEISSDNEYCINTREFLNHIKDALLNTENIDEKINQNMFFNKVRQTRSAYYQIEHALHFQLMLLFERNSEREFKSIYKLNIKNSSQKIYEKIEAFFKQLKPEENPDLSKNEKWKALAEEIEREFRTHVVFELLTYFYLKDLRTGKTGAGTAAAPQNEEKPNTADSTPNTYS